MQSILLRLQELTEDQNIILNEVNDSLREELKNKETELKKTGHRLAEAEAFKEVIAEKLKSEQSTHFNLKERYELLKDSFEEQKQELEKKKSDLNSAHKALQQTAAENTTLVVEKERLEVQIASKYKTLEATLAVEQAKNQELLAERTKQKDQAALQMEMFCTTCKAKENIMQMEGKSTQIKQEQIHDRIQGSNDTTLQQSKIRQLEEELQLVTEKLNEADIRAKLYQEKYKHMVMEKKALANRNDLHLQAPTPIPEPTGNTPICPADAPPINNHSRPRSHSLTPTSVALECHNANDPTPLVASPLPPSVSESLAAPGITLAQLYSTSPASAQSHISHTDAVGQASGTIHASVSPPRIAEPMTDPDCVDGLRDMSQSPECISQENLLQTVISTVSDLPQCTQLSDGKKRLPVAPRSSKLLDCLRDAAPTYHWGPGTIFFLPGRLLEAGSQHYVVVEPASQLIPNTGHRIHSRIGDYIGQTRDLFVTDNEWIFYAGSYKLFKIGKAPSAAFKFSDFHDITLTSLTNACMPKNHLQAFPREQRIREWIEKGVIKLDCIGLQCVNFNTSLSTMLIQHHDEGVRKRKREESEARERRYGPRMRPEFDYYERSRPLARLPRSRSRSPPRNAYEDGYQMPPSRSRLPAQRSLGSPIDTFFPDREVKSLLTRLENGLFGYTISLFEMYLLFPLLLIPASVLTQTQIDW
ncbi:hypothetical protein C8R41DRAFT_985376 [Lentinula lateritia]|uniref:Uncharacterized protein n=1 Tax=Lentinula lateritia TaxID=40482 RepID=A0ABQ8UYY0_9AGAR|nr:hypothetical protein C8R41DRAFT_985376 [Lentinula lateritia]